MMEYSKRLRSYGIRITPQRLAVYAMLMEMGHSSVEEMVAALCQIHPNVTVSTVYNVLDCFARHGLINRLSTPQGKLFYDVNTTTHHHIVTSCGTLIDYDAPQLTAMINDFFDKNPISGHTINSVSLQLYEKPFF